MKMDSAVCCTSVLSSVPEMEDVHATREQSFTAVTMVKSCLPCVLPACQVAVTVEDLGLLLCPGLLSSLL